MLKKKNTKIKITTNLFPKRQFFKFDYGSVPNGTLGPCGPPQSPHFHEVKSL